MICDVSFERTLYSLTSLNQSLDGVYFFMILWNIYISFFIIFLNSIYKNIRQDRHPTLGTSAMYRYNNNKKKKKMQINSKSASVCIVS